MQLDFTPLPAAGDLPMAEAPPADGAPLAEVPSDGSGNPGQETAGGQKGFRETMDDLLRAVSSDEAPEAAPAVITERAAEAPEPPLPETAAAPVVVVPAEDLPITKGVLVAAPAGEEMAQGAQARGGPAVAPELEKPQVAVTPKATPDTAASEKPHIVSDTLEGPKPEAAVKAAGVIKPAVLDRGGQATDPRVSALPNGGTDLGEARAALAKASRPTTADPETRKADTGPPPTVNGGDLQTRPAQAEVIRSPLAQDAPDQRSAPQTESAAPVEKAAAVKESQLQTFSGLMESVEKGGGEAKLPGAAGDTPLDTIAGSGPKGAPTPQSEPVNGVKADPAPPPQPVAKEEVIQQIVNSAKLRLNGGQSEMRIQLKPEHLGQVRLNISTDQHQVVVKVVAELPAVKELLETNLPQLRSELQGQGLEIDKFDVSVGGDAESQNKEQQTWGQRRSGGRKGAFAQAGREHQDQAADAESRPQPPASPAAKGVDYFA